MARTLHPLRSPAALLGAGLVVLAQGQNICTIDLGADRTICQGQTATLSAPPGASSYSWSTGESTPSITVGAAGAYSCTAVVPSGELVVNGDFSAGNTGFTSQFTYSSDLVPEPTYFVDANTVTHHSNFFATGNGLFLMANAGASDNLRRVWQETISVCPGTTYTISFRGCDISGTSPPAVSWYINNSYASGPFQMPLGPGNWQSWNWTWTAPAGQYSATFALRVINPVSGGSDLGVDDISIQGAHTASDAVNVSVTPLPSFSIGSDLHLCNGQVRLLNASVPGGTYIWNNGSTAPTHLVNGPGPVSVTVTANSCSAIRSINVQYSPVPNVDLLGDRSICTGDVLTLDATYGGATYLWNDGATTPTHDAGVQGPYVVDVTANGCTGHDSIYVTVNTPPAVALGNDTVLCQGSTLDLDASVPGATYHWQDGSTSANFPVTSAGDYTVDVTKTGCSASDAIHVDFDTSPVAGLTDHAICAGDALLLDATVSGASYLWDDGSTGATHDAGTQGPYEVDVTRGACTVHDSVYVTVHPVPAVDLGGDPIVCPGQTASFDATTTGATYLWNDGSTGPTLTTAVPGPYNVQVTVDGCTGTDAVTLSNFNLQTVDLGGDRTICAGTSTSLGIDVPGATYLWNTGATANAITASVAADYWVDATLNGCTVRDSVHVFVTPLPVFSLGSDQWVCPEGTATLDATTAGASYLWSNGTTGPTLSAIAGTWDVTVTVNGCSSSDEAVIQERTPPTIDLGNDTLLCPGATLDLHASALGLSGAWSDGTSGPMITVDAPGTYGVTVMDAFSCTGEDDITITYATLPPVDLGNDTLLCGNALITLDATTPGASHYVWNNGSTGHTLPAGGFGTYWVDVTIGTCVVTDSIDISTASAPTVHLGNDTTLCPGATLLVHATASAGSSLMWSDGTAGADHTVDAAGTYAVTATNAVGCTASDAITVSYLNAQSLDLGNDTTLCPGTTLVLHAALPGGTNHWSNGSSGASLTVTSGGTYGVNVLIGACSFDASIEVGYVTLPALDLGADHDLCANASLDLVATSVVGATYLWDDGSSSALRTISGGGTFWARAMLSGCTTSDTVVVHAVPLPVVDLGNDTALCPGAILPLDVSVPDGTYHWSNGSTSPALTATPGTWTVDVTAHGCTASDGLTITALPAPSLALPTDTMLCEGTSWTIDVAQSGASYQWQDGSTDSDLQVDQAGQYHVLVELGGCTAEASVSVLYFSPTVLDLGPDTALCPGATLLLYTAIPGATLTWQDGSSASSFTVHEAGTYEVTASMGSCHAQDAIHVDYVPLLVPDLGTDRVLCGGDSLLLRVLTGDASVHWSDGSSGDSLIVRTGGTYNVTLDLESCVASDAVTITYRPFVDRIDLGPDRRLCPGMTATLDATTMGASYVWSIGSHDAALQVTTPGTYRVHLSGQCIDAADTVVIIPGDCAPEVFAPNAFTPDGDGVNDTFVPLFSGDALEYRFQIFDRWGAAIFSSASPGVPWDGTAGGMEAPQGVYVWSLRYHATGDDGVTQKRLTGHVTLLR